MYIVIVIATQSSIAYLICNNRFSIGLVLNPPPESAAGKGANATEDIMFSAGTKESHPFRP